MIKKFIQKLVLQNPEVHTVIIVAFFVSVPANFFVSLYLSDSLPDNSWSVILANIIFLFAGVCYARVAREASLLWRDADRREGRDHESSYQKAKLLLDKTDRKTVEVAQRKLIQTALLVALGMALLFFYLVINS